MALISEVFKANVLVQVYTFLKIPLLFFCRPRIMELESNKSVLKLPLNRRTKNHLGSMYFGAMSIGAEAAIAVTAVKKIVESNKKIDYIFKDFKAQFYKRAEGGDVHFVCEQGEAIRQLIEKAIISKERETQTFKSYAIVPKKDPNLIVAEFEVTLSVKYRG